MGGKDGGFRPFGEVRSDSKPEFEREPKKQFSQPRKFAGAKARLSIQPIAARLKSCPCYKSPGCKAPGCKAAGYKAPGYKAPTFRGSQI